MDVLTRLAAHAPAVAGGLAVSAFLVRSLGGLQHKRQGITQQRPSALPGQLLRVRLRVQRRRHVHLHIEVLEGKQEGQEETPAPTLAALHEAPELAPLALLLGTQLDTAAEDEGAAAHGATDACGMQEAKEDVTDDTAEAAEVAAQAAEEAAWAGDAGMATSQDASSTTPAARRSVTMSPAVEAEQQLREAAGKQQTLADVLRELAQSKRRNAKLRERLTRLEVSLAPSPAAAAAATAPATAATAGSGHNMADGGGSGSTGAAAAAGGEWQPASAAPVAADAAGTAQQLAVAAGSEVGDAAVVDAPGSSSTRDAPSKGPRSASKVSSKSPARPAVSSSSRGDQRPKAGTAAAAAASEAAARPSAPGGQLLSPAVVVKASRAVLPADASPSSSPATAAPAAPAAVSAAVPAMPVSNGEAAAAAGPAAALSPSGIATPLSFAHAESAAALVPESPASGATRPRIAPGDPKSARAPGSSAGAGAGAAGSDAGAGGAGNDAGAGGAGSDAGAAAAAAAAAAAGSGGDGGAAASERSRSSTKARSVTVLDVLRERKAAKDEQARLVARLAAQVAQIQAANASLMDAFRANESKLAHLTEENASLRSEVASLRAGGMGTPTNGSELGQFKESLLHPAAVGTHSETPFSDDGSFRAPAHARPRAATDAPSISSSLTGSLFRFGPASGVKRRGAGEADGSVLVTPASSAAELPVQSVMALLDTFGGGGL